MITCAMNYGSWFLPHKTFLFMLHITVYWTKGWLISGFFRMSCSSLLICYISYVKWHRPTGCSLDKKLTLLSFTLACPLLQVLTTCISHSTPCWLQSPWPLWDRLGAGFCWSAWLGIRNALLVFPPSSYSSDSYQSHQEICDCNILWP